MSHDAHGILYSSLSHLVDSLIPPTVPNEVRSNIYNQLISFVDHSQKQNQYTNYDLGQIFSDHESIFKDQQSWRKFQQIVKLLLKYRNADQVARYITLLDSLAHDRPVSAASSSSSSAGAAMPATVVNDLNNKTARLYNPMPVPQQQQIHSGYHLNTQHQPSITSQRSAFTTQTMKNINSSSNNNNNHNYNNNNVINTPLSADSMFEPNPSSRMFSRNSSGFHEGSSNILNNNYNNSGSLTDNASKRRRGNFNFNFRGYSNQSLNDIVNALYAEFNPMYTEESEVLQYIYYTLLGSTSELFPVEKTHNTINIPDSISNSYSGVLHYLFEASLLYKHLSTISKQNSDSQVKTAFLSHVQTFSQEYMKIINELSMPNNDVGKTLIDIYKHLIDQIDKLRFIYSVSNQLDALHGNEFLSLIHSYTNFGDSIIKDLSESFFIVSCEPYYNILENWLLNGTLIDNNDEFFIKYDKESTKGTAAQFANIVSLQFDSEKFPKFLPSKTSQKIYQIGKTIVYLRDVCKEYNFLNGYNQKYRQFLQEQTSGLKFCNHNQFSLLIESQYQELTSYFSHVLYNNFKIDYHIINLKNFLLLSKGDFIAALIDNSSSILSEPSQSLSTTQLSQILTNSIYWSSLKNYPRDTLLRLDARILSLNTSANFGWDVFTLDYKLEDPLNLILYDNFKGLKTYLKLFNFLWKLSRVKHMLDKSWLESSTISKHNLKVINREVLAINNEKKNTNGNIALSRTERNKLWIIKSFTRLNIIRNMFVKFISKILGHLHSEVIDNEFKELFSKLNKSKDMFMKNAAAKSNNNNNNKSKLFNYMSKFNRVLLPNKAYSQRCNEAIFADDYTSHTTATSPIGNMFSNINQHYSTTNENFLIPKPEIHEANYQSYSIDELIQLHSEYLTKISSYKLIDSSRKSSIGAFSNKFYIHQINNLISYIFKFLQAENEFNNLVLDIVSKLELAGDNSNAMMNDVDVNNSNDNDNDDGGFQSNWAESYKQLSIVFKNIRQNVLLEYTQKHSIFVKDLINDNSTEIRNLGYNLNG